MSTMEMHFKARSFLNRGFPRFRCMFVLDGRDRALEINQWELYLCFDRVFEMAEEAFGLEKGALKEIKMIYTDDGYEQVMTRSNGKTIGK